MVIGLFTNQLLNSCLIKRIKHYLARLDQVKASLVDSHLSTPRRLPLNLPLVSGETWHRIVFDHSDLKARAGNDFGALISLTEHEQIKYKLNLDAWHAYDLTLIDF